MKPNLFKFATSELSQDAFICWLLEWANPEFKGNLLNEIAIKFIEELSGIGKDTIKEVKVKRQYKKVIDILVVINQNSAILIEDKVHTLNHSNQLSRYAELLREEFNEDNLSLIYLKTGDQSNYSIVESKGYKTFTRENFLTLLKEGKDKGVKSEIFTDFLDYLTTIDNSVNSFKVLPVDKWHRNSWIGFYIELQKRLGQGNWGVVPQKNGGFVGFWWHGNYMAYKETGFDFYLQLEQGKFCFKISPRDVQLNYEIREFYRSILFQKLNEHGVKFKRNGSCRKGKTKTMTVAKLKSSYLFTDSNGIIDFERTIENIKEIESVIKEIKTTHNK